MVIYSSCGVSRSEFLKPSRLGPRLPKKLFDSIFPGLWLVSWRWQRALIGWKERPGSSVGHYRVHGWLSPAIGTAAWHTNVDGFKISSPGFHRLAQVRVRRAFLYHMWGNFLMVIRTGTADSRHLPGWLILGSVCQPFTYLYLIYSKFHM